MSVAKKYNPIGGTLEWVHCDEVPSYELKYYRKGAYRMAQDCGTSNGPKVWGVNFVLSGGGVGDKGEVVEAKVVCDDRDVAIALAAIDAKIDAKRLVGVLASAVR